MVTSYYHMLFLASHGMVSKHAYIHRAQAVSDACIVSALLHALAGRIVSALQLKVASKRVEMLVLLLVIGDPRR